MRAALHLAGAQRQDGLAAVQRLNLTLLVHAQHDGAGLLRRVEVEPDDVTFSTKNGSLESLKFSCKCGFSPNARQIRMIAFCVSPLALAIERVLQCVAPTGFFSSVRVTTASILASVILRGWPGRGASPKPASR